MADVPAVSAPYPNGLSSQEVIAAARLAGRWPPVNMANKTRKHGPPVLVFESSAACCQNALKTQQLTFLSFPSVKRTVLTN
jgi:hypothetical protein